jgi:hypothetical protein
MAELWMLLNRTWAAHGSHRRRFPWRVFGTVASIVTTGAAFEVDAYTVGDHNAWNILVALVAAGVEVFWPAARWVFA